MRNDVRTGPDARAALGGGELALIGGAGRRRSSSVLRVETALDGYAVDVLEDDLEAGIQGLPCTAQTDSDALLAVAHDVGSMLGVEARSRKLAVEAVELAVLFDHLVANREGVAVGRDLEELACQLDDRVFLVALVLEVEAAGLRVGTFALTFGARQLVLRLLVAAHLVELLGAGDDSCELGLACHGRAFLVVGAVFVRAIAFEV